MLRLFARWRRPRPDLAPQFTTFERQALEIPGSGPEGLPATTLDQMQRDSMIQTALTLKRLGVLAARWTLEGGHPLTTEFIRQTFLRMEGSPSTILDQAMDAFAKGWSVQEMVLEETEGRIELRGLRAKNPAHFGLEINAFGEVEALVHQLPGEEARRLDRSRFVLFTHRPHYSRPKGRSDLEAAYPHYQQKLRLLEAWRLCLERYGAPTMLASFERTASANEQNAMLKSLSNLARNTAIVYPSDFRVEPMAAGSEPSRGFMEAIEFHNREIARAILGQTLTTDEGRRVGSLALGRVHLQVLLVQLQAIREELADRVMNEQIINPLIRWNFGDLEPPRFRFDPLSLSAFRTGEIDASKG